MASCPVKPASGNPQSIIYRSINGTPAENMRKAVALAGGAESVVGKDDIVIIKPNVQWWNQGAPNMGALYTFIKMIIDRSGGFSGEVVVAENCHRGSQPWTSAGWSHTFERNRSISGVKNYNELSKQLKNDFGDRYSTVHWIDVQYGARRVFSVGEDGGYTRSGGATQKRLESTN